MKKSKILQILTLGRRRLHNNNHDVESASNVLNYVTFVEFIDTVESMLRWKFQVISTTLSLCSSGMVAYGI